MWSSEEKALRLDEVRAITRLSPSLIYRLERLGEFPRRRALTSGRRCAWLLSEVVSWLRSRPTVLGEAVEGGQMKEGIACLSK
jgi:prophage regulatory protein